VDQLFSLHLCASIDTIFVYIRIMHRLWITQNMDDIY